MAINWNISINGCYHINGNNCLEYKMITTPDGFINTEGHGKTINPVNFIAIADGSIIKPPVAIRHKLPKDRRSITMTFRLFYNETEEEQFYLTVGLYPDGSPGELFINTSKSGSTMKGLLDTWAITMSMALQHGVPLRAICDKLSFTRFEPSGNTGQEFGFASSAIDYIVRWMSKRFLNHDYREAKV